MAISIGISIIRVGPVELLHRLCVPGRRDARHVVQVLVRARVAHALAVRHVHPHAAPHEAELRPLDPCARIAHQHAAPRRKPQKTKERADAQVEIVSRSSSMNGLSLCSRSSCSAYRHHSDSSYSFSHSSGVLCWSSSSLRAAVRLCSAAETGVSVRSGRCESDGDGDLRVSGRGCTPARLHTYSAPRTARAARS